MLLNILVVFVASVAALICGRLAYRLTVSGRADPTWRRTSGMIYNRAKNRFEPTTKLSNATVDRILGD